MVSIAATGDQLLDTSLGIVNREWLSDDLMGLSHVPPSEIKWVFDLGSGDGSWSKVATTYAPDARVLAVDWRRHAVAAVENCLYAAIGDEETIWVPTGITIRNMNPIVNMCAVKGVTFARLLEENAVTPKQTVVRYQGSANALSSILNSIEGLRMLTVIFYGGPELVGKILTTLKEHFETMTAEKKGDVFYVKCYNEGFAVRNVQWDGLGGVSDCDAAGDESVDHQP